MAEYTITLDEMVLFSQKVADVRKLSAPECLEAIGVMLSVGYAADFGSCTLYCAAGPSPNEEIKVLSCTSAVDLHVRVVADSEYDPDHPSILQHERLRIMSYNGTPKFDGDQRVYTIFKELKGKYHRIPGGVQDQADTLKFLLSGKKVH